jgi:hypothetical protein
MPMDLRKPNDEPIAYKKKDFLSRILEGYHPLTSSATRFHPGYR